MRDVARSVRRLFRRVLQFYSRRFGWLLGGTLLGLCSGCISLCIIEPNIPGHCDIVADAVGFRTHAIACVIGGTVLGAIAGAGVELLQHLRKRP